MASPMTDLTLIERLEKCEGPDIELDAAIVAHLNNAIVKRYPPTDDFGPKDRWQFWSEDGKHFLGSEGKYPVPPFTESVDMVLRYLVPEGWLWFVLYDQPSSQSRYEAHVWKNYEHPLDKNTGTGATPAISLTIACLKARQEGAP